MNLDAFLKTANAPSVKELAKRLKVPPVSVSQWRTGVRRVPAEHCPAVEHATAGAVRCEELRPDVDWAYLRCTCEDQKAA